MDSLEHVEAKLLEELGLFPPDVLSRMENYNILSVGHFLGVTRGLQKLDLLKDLNVSPEVIEQFRAVLPDELIRKYREPEEIHPTGLLIPNQKTQRHDNEEEAFGG